MGITTTVRRQEWKISGEWRTVNSPSASFQQLYVCMIQLYIKCDEKREQSAGRDEGEKNVMGEGWRRSMEEECMESTDSSIT